MNIDSMLDEKGRFWRFGLRSTDAVCDMDPGDRNLCAQAFIGTKKSYVVAFHTEKKQYFVKSLSGDVEIKEIFLVNTTLNDAGTPAGRLRGLLDELAKRFPEAYDAYRSDPSELRYLEAIDKLLKNK